ncbi:uncharacterized protein LOC125516457 [Triticum urartu]|uniref:uncharacterized protein LOC125516457 n=1 Tax=Triticum urartu TaxID=4572 RepID=UPI00204491B0|nr:uncharacterized protein LOC125516457 [Triticum urartu]
MGRAVPGRPGPFGQSVSAREPACCSLHLLFPPPHSTTSLLPAPLISFLHLPYCPPHSSPSFIWPVACSIFSAPDPMLESMADKPTWVTSLQMSHGEPVPFIEPSPSFLPMIKSAAQQHTTVAIAATNHHEPAVSRIQSVVEPQIEGRLGDLDLFELDSWHGGQDGGTVAETRISSPISVVADATVRANEDALIQKTEPIVQQPTARVGCWKRRNKGVTGPDARVCPSKTSYLQDCIARATDNHSKDLFAPIEGILFDTCNEAYEMYNLFSWENGFGIRHYKTRTNGTGYKAMHEIVCQCQGKSEKENSESCRTGCKAMVRLLRTKDHGWYVSLFVNEHNHPLSAGYEETRYWNSHSVIDPLLKGFIRNLRENNVSLSKVYNILCVAHGDGASVPFRKENLKYLCSRIAQESINEDIYKTVDLLQQMKTADPNLEVCVNVDKEGSVQTILWCTGKNREDYAHFGDVVTFDTTCRTNLYNMPFGIFVGVNNHFQSTIFGGVLMRHENIKGFEWTFRTFVETMNGKHPQTILTDQCKAMEGAIKSTLPNTQHRWCKWHVLRCAKEKLGPVYSKNSDFKREFHAIINEIICVKEFECKWSELLQKFNLADNLYLENLYSKRHMWAKPYFSGVFCAGMTSTQRSESANHMLKRYIPRSSPMHLFVKQYNKLLQSRSADESRQQHTTKMVLIRNDVLKIPPKNIVKRWTKWAKDVQPCNLPVPLPFDQQDDLSYRQNILYIAALETVKETSCCKSMLGKTLRVLQDLKTEAISLGTPLVTFVPGTCTIVVPGTPFVISVPDTGLHHHGRPAPALLEVRNFVTYTNTLKIHDASHPLSVQTTPPSTAKHHGRAAPALLEVRNFVTHADTPEIHDASHPPSVQTTPASTAKVPFAHTVVTMAGEC